MRLFEEIKQGFDDLKEERKSKLALYPVYIHTDENGGSSRLCVE
ncbi:hypothetical protein [Spartinivicinus ruber]|nr:hypothetical protein [Spartinivicinus ruber]